MQKKLRILENWNFRVSGGVESKNNQILAYFGYTGDPPKNGFFEMSGPVAPPPGMVDKNFLTKKMRLDLSFKMRGRTAS